jgi:hypothetical protein
MFSLAYFSEHGEMQNADLVVDASIAARNTGSSPGFLVTAAGDDFQRRTLLQQIVFLFLLVPLQLKLGPRENIHSSLFFRAWEILNADLVIDASIAAKNAGSSPGFSQSTGKF